MDDNFDMNDFVNFDQGFGASPTQTASHIDMSQAGPSAAFHNQQAAMMQHQRQYNGPSHDYSQFPQQVGLPSGTTHHLDAVNAFSRQAIPAAFNPSRLVAYNTGFEMDAEPSSSADAKAMYPNDGFAEEFAVDPSALGPNAAKSRAWPGMHSQQAKAQQDARQTQQQASRQASEQQMNMQRQLPAEFDTSAARGNASDRSNSSGPEVNDQISKLLNQMRQNSDMGDFDDNSQGNGDGSAMARLKKDEDDMDEDERLLASEEGKKLTSKERRQLRNKVSARAFRSRRKEYIGQLEGEVNAKAAECDDLKQTNRHLLEQNRQLTQLTKAMLAHPAFGNFMQDMSNDPSFLNSFGGRQQRQQQQQTQQQVPKQEPQQHRQDSVHVGMSMVPENNLDFSMLNLGNNNWNNFQQPQIFAVYDVPTPASIQEALPSLNPKSATATSKSCRSAKPDMPVVEHPIASPRSVKQTAPEITRAPRCVDDSHDDLFSDDYAIAAPPAPISLTDAARQLEQSLSSKSPSKFQLRVVQTMDEATAVESVDRMFAALEDVSERIASMTFHLPQ